MPSPEPTEPKRITPPRHSYAINFGHLTGTTIDTLVRLAAGEVLKSPSHQLPPMHYSLAVNNNTISPFAEQVCALALAKAEITALERSSSRPLTVVYSWLARQGQRAYPHPTIRELADHTLADVADYIAAIYDHRANGQHSTEEVVAEAINGLHAAEAGIHQIDAIMQNPWPGDRTAQIRHLIQKPMAELLTGEGWKLDGAFHSPAVAKWQQRLFARFGMTDPGAPVIDANYAIATPVNKIVIWLTHQKRLQLY